MKRGKGRGLTRREYWRIKQKIEILKLGIEKSLAIINPSKVTSKQMYDIAEMCVQCEVAGKVTNWFENINTPREENV